MQVSHKNRVPCTTLQCSYNAARTWWLSGGYRLCQWVGQCNGQVDRVNHSWPESKDSAKVELIDRVGHKLPRIDRFDRLDRFRGLAAHHNKHCWWAFRGYKRRWRWTTLNPKIGVFSEFFCDLRQPHTFQEWTASKSLVIDQDNLASNLGTPLKTCDFCYCRLI